jgi:putative oxidoreductase
VAFLSELHRLNDWALLVLRLGVGMVFLVHGLQKRALWKVQPSAQLSTGTLSLLRVLSIAEPLGALSVLSGLLTQLAAAGFVIVMLGAIRLKAVRERRGFTGEGGWEFEFLLLCGAAALLILGAGRWSLDRAVLGL